MIAWECVENICTIWLPDPGLMGQMIIMLGLMIATIFAIRIIVSAIG